MSIVIPRLVCPVDYKDGAGKTEIRIREKKVDEEYVKRTNLLEQNMRTGKYMTTQEYMEMFQNVVDVIEHSGGSIGYVPAGEAFIAKEKNIIVAAATPEQLLLMAEESKQWYLATAFLKGADKIRYGKLIEDTRNSFLQGNNNFPRTVQLAYNLLVNWRQDRIGMQGASNDGVAFAHLNS
eukprot:scaffold83313_cov41-Attheya_sp.AAC.1